MQFKERFNVWISTNKTIYLVLLKMFSILSEAGDWERCCKYYHIHCYYYYIHNIIIYIVIIIVFIIAISSIIVVLSYYSFHI